MDLAVLPDQSIPAYRQIFLQIRSQILSGRMKPGTALPPIRTVSRELSVSVITVRTAWDQLEEDGLIETRAGSGCYVASLQPGELRARRDEALAAPLSDLVLKARELGYTRRELQEKIDGLW